MARQILNKMPVHVIKEDKTEVKLALLSDLHLDNPKCVQSVLEQHLQYCLANNIRVILNGDTFCAMEGKGDRRGGKNLREHMVDGNYLNRLVEYVSDFFLPYIDILELITYGNHETAVLNHKEYDLLQGLNSQFYLKTGKEVALGGYTGWIVVEMPREYQPKQLNKYRIKYHHGFGGGAPVTKGVIDFNRMSSYVDNADALWMGHKHTDTHIRHKVEVLTAQNTVYYKTVDFIRTPTYKDEHSQGYGWATEKGISPAEIGGRMITLKSERERFTENGKEYANNYIASQVETLPTRNNKYINTIGRMSC